MHTTNVDVAVVVLVGNQRKERNGNNITTAYLQKKTWRKMSKWIGWELFRAGKQTTEEEELKARNNGNVERSKKQKEKKSR